MARDPRRSLLLFVFLPLLDGALTFCGGRGKAEPTTVVFAEEFVALRVVFASDGIVLIVIVLIVATAAAAAAAASAAVVPELLVFEEIRHVVGHVEHVANVQLPQQSAVAGVVGAAKIQPAARAPAEPAA